MGGFAADRPATIASGLTLRVVTTAGVHPNGWTASPVETGRPHVTASLLAHAAGRARPRARLRGLTAALAALARLVAPYLLTASALGCAVTAAATYRPWAGLTAAALALLLLELRIHIETRPDPPVLTAEPAPRTYG